MKPNCKLKLKVQNICIKLLLKFKRLNITNHAQKGVIEVKMQKKSSPKQPKWHNVAHFSHTVDVLVEISCFIKKENVYFEH